MPITKQPQETSDEPQVVLGWHWLFEPSKLRDGQKVHVGRIYRLPAGQRPELCSQGYHASEKLLDAVKYAPGTWLCRVELSGEIVRESYQQDKLVASTRRILWMMDAEPLIRRFLADLATEVFDKMRAEGEEPHEVMEDLVEAVKVTDAYLRGTATKREFRVARVLASETYNELRYTRLGELARLAIEYSYGAVATKPLSILRNIYELGGSGFGLSRDEFNARFEAAVLAVAPKEAPPLTFKQRWDRTQKLRKPVCKGNKAVAATLVLQKDNEAAIERLVLTSYRLVQQRRKAYQEANYAVQVARQEAIDHAKKLYMSDAPTESTDMRAFNRKLHNLASAARSAAEQALLREQAYDRAYSYNAGPVARVFQSLPKKQREALQAKAAPLM